MNLDTKQKILIPVTVVVLGILGWQLYGLMATDSVATPSVRPTTMSAINNVAQPRQPIPAADMAAPQAVRQPAAVVSDQDKQRLREISQSDTEYLKLIQEYQLLQVQRRIAEDTRAIAVAKLETVKALAETSTFGGSGNLGSNLSMGKMDGDYKLVFTGQEAGQWTATLKMNDQLMDVVTGTHLPDGYKVMMVDGDSVTLQKADKQKVVSFLGINESQVAKQEENGPTAKQAKAEALLQIIAPEQVKKKQLELATAKPDTKTSLAPVAQTSASKPAESPLAKPSVTVVSSEAVVKPEVTNAKSDKSALTAAFLAKDEKKQAPAIKQPAPANEVTPVVVPEHGKAASQANVEKKIEITSEVPAKPVEAATISKVESAKLVTPLPAAKPTVATEPASNMGVGGFTIQLMSDRNEAAVKAFIKENNLADKASYSQSFSNGQKWYVLTYGQYNSHEEAKRALHDLPKTLQGWQPFVRKLEGFKKAVPAKKPVVAKPVNKQALPTAANKPVSVQVSGDQEPSEIIY